jgi:hypothetical protein
MRNAFLGFFMLIFFFSSCSKGKENSAPQIPNQEKNVPLRTPAAASQGGSALRIASLTLAPEAPSVLDDVTAVPVLANPGSENIEFQFQWFINGQEIEQAEGDTLQKSSLKKGAWIFCQARVVDGRQESPYRRSDIIRVRNSLPLLNLAPMAAFEVPGDIQYQAAASDPDGDDLTFEVLSPLEQGIALDAKTGVLSWHLTEEMVKNLGESIEIKIAVSDGEGEKVTGTITLQFTSTKK